jgi:hypothetical protein
MPNNYEKAYLSLVPWLDGVPEPVELQFLGRGFRVGAGGVEQLSGPPVHVNGKSVLIWYVTQYGGGEKPSYDFRPISSFSFGIFAGSGVSWQQKQQPRFGGLTAEGFRREAERIGAAPLRPERYGESWLLHAFPELPALLTFTEADEEFPADVDVKFGANATRVLPFETLAVLQSLIESEFR